MKKLILTALVAASAFAATASYAACTRTGYVERINNLPGTQVSTIYIRPAGVATGGGAPNNTWFSATIGNDPKIISAANAALTSRTFVAITGNIATCPAANKSIGGVVNLVVAP